MSTMDSANHKKNCGNHENNQNKSNVLPNAHKHNKSNANAGKKKKKKNGAEKFHQNGAQINHQSTHNIGFLPPGVAHREQMYHTNNSSKCKNDEHALREQFNYRQEALELFSNRFDVNVPIPRRLNRVSASLVEAVNDFHFAMMNDEPRNEFYYELLKSAIVPGKSGVLEIGAGSGLLSMMAAKLGAKWVVAVEGAPEMAHLAQENIIANNLSDRITVLNMLSTELTLKDLPARPDILVSEIFGTLLLGESAHDYIADVKRRLLSPSTLILPLRGVQYAVPIECPHLESICSVNSWRSINLSHVMALQDTVSVVFTKQYGFRMSSVPYKILAEPVKILEVDFNSGSMIYGSTPTSSTTSKVGIKSQNKSHQKKKLEQNSFDVHTIATSSGIAHAWLFYWNVYNSAENKKQEEQPQQQEQEIICEWNGIDGKKDIIDNYNSNNEELVMSTAPWETTNNFARDMQWGQALQLIDANCSNLLWNNIDNNNNMSTESVIHCTSTNDMPQQLCMAEGSSYHFRCTLSSDNVLMHLQFLNVADV